MQQERTKMMIVTAVLAAALLFAGYRIGQVGADGRRLAAINARANGGLEPKPFLNGGGPVDPGHLPPGAQVTIHPGPNGHGQIREVKLPGGKRLMEYHATGGGPGDALPPLPGATLPPRP